MGNNLKNSDLLSKGKIVETYFILSQVRNTECSRADYNFEEQQ